MERAIMRIVRRILDIGFSDPSAVFSSPSPPDGANKPRRSTSPHQRATTSSGTKNRPDSLPTSKNSGTSALDLEPNSSADVDAAASSTGPTARRRRQRQNRRQRLRAASNTNPGQERPEDLDEGKATAFDSKNSASEQQSSVELDEGKPTVSNPKSAASDQECFAELDIDAKNRQDKLAAKKRRHSQNRRERKRAAKNRPDSLPLSKNSIPSALDLDANSSADVHAAASSTGRTARRRRQRQRAASNTNPSQERSQDLDADKATASDSKNSASDQECLAELDLDAKNGQDKLAAKKQRHRQNRRERKRATTESSAPSWSLTGRVTRGFQTDESSTEKGNLVVSKKKPALPAHPKPDLASTPAAPQRPSRLPTSVPEHGHPAAATLGDQCLDAPPGRLDDLQGVDNFFYRRRGLFDQPDEDDEDRVKHLRYLEACSSLKSSLTYCLACSLSDDKAKHPPIGNDIENMTKHMESAHKGDCFKCGKKRCCAMATTLKDINNHRYYAHGL